MDRRPIGILDSGFGGLSIWKEIVKQLPKERIIYFGDNANFPYGAKTPGKISERVKKVIEFLVKKDCKLVVIACNTATTSGIEYYRNLFKSLPLVGVVPVIKTAANLTRKKKVGILATPATIETQYYKNLIQTWGQGIEVLSVGVVKLAEIVEEGETNSEEVEKILKKNLEPLLEKGIDCLCLGCTHFSFLKGEIEKIVGPGCQVLDSSGAVARQVSRVLKAEDLEGNSHNPAYEFYTSGGRVKFQEIAQKLLFSVEVNGSIGNVRF